jgi:short-subunit dehydrogenase
MATDARQRWLAGRPTLVTGATGGLGPLVAEALAEAGAKLALSGLPGSGLDEVAERLADAPGGRPTVLPVDLRTPGVAARLADDAVSALGGVDVLVYGAGLERVGRFEAQTPDALEDVLRVNLLSAAHLARAVVPGMLAQGYGRMVFVASLSGKVGPPYTGAYAASKAGLIGLARSLRSEYRGRGVSASAVVPGFVRGVGMYARAREAAGFRRAWALGTVRADAVAGGVLRALRHDPPEVLVQPGPTRWMLTLGELLPGLVGQRLAEWSGASRLFREWADARVDPEGTPPGALPGVEDAGRGEEEGP